jgi:hypothetical protein
MTPSQIKQAARAVLALRNSRLPHPAKPSLPAKPDSRRSIVNRQKQGFLG